MESGKLKKKKKKQTRGNKKKKTTRGHGVHKDNVICTVVIETTLIHPVIHILNSFKYLMYLCRA